MIMVELAPEELMEMIEKLCGMISQIKKDPSILKIVPEDPGLIMMTLFEVTIENQAKERAKDAIKKAASTH